MSTLELTLLLDRTDVVCGESLALRAVLENRGSQPVFLQTFPDVPLASEFRDARTGELRFLSSHADFREALTAGMQMPPPPAPRFDSLAPGQSRRFFADPALYLRRILPPGAYLLAARLTGPDYEVASAPIEIRVSPLRASALAVAHCVYQYAMLALGAHTGEDRTPWIFYRETQTGIPVEAAVDARLEQAASSVATPPCQSTRRPTFRAAGSHGSKKECQGPPRLGRRYPGKPRRGSCRA